MDRRNFLGILASVPIAATVEWRPGQPVPYVKELLPKIEQATIAEATISEEAYLIIGGGHFEVKSCTLTKFQLPAKKLKKPDWIASGSTIYEQDLEQPSQINMMLEINNIKIGSIYPAEAFVAWMEQFRPIKCKLWFKTAMQEWQFKAFITQVNVDCSRAASSVFIELKTTGEVKGV